MTATALIVRNLPATETNETSLVLPEGMSVSEWEAVGEQIGRAHRASGWWIGDWINYGESAWGEKYEDAQRITGLSYNYLAQCAMVARTFDSLDRSKQLSWTHHFKAHSLDEPKKWLEKAAAEGWSVKQLVEESKSAPAAAIFPKRRHTAVVAAATALVKTAKPRGNTQPWVREMTDELSPPEARRQLTVLNNARAVLEEVIAAVEYRAATPHSFMGR